MWEKEQGLSECDHSQLKLANLEKVVDELLTMKTKMVDQLKNVEANSEHNALRYEVMKLGYREKNLCILLIVSWIFFADTIMILK